MNPLDSLKALPWRLVVALGLALCLMTNLYLGKRDALATEKANYKAFAESVEREGKEAKEENDRKDAEHKQNLKKIKEENESKIPRVRADAVANYLASVGLRQRSAANPGGGAVPGNGAGIRLDDDDKRQCLPDEAFIRDAAEDAAKLEAWQRYCRMNRCPITD